MSFEVAQILRVVWPGLSEIWPGLSESSSCSVSAQASCSSKQLENLAVGPIVVCKRILQSLMCGQAFLKFGKAHPAAAIAWTRCLVDSLLIHDGAQSIAATIGDILTTDAVGDALASNPTLVSRVLSNCASILSCGTAIIPDSNLVAYMESWPSATS
jgi:hypothetical protein